MNQVLVFKARCSTFVELLLIAVSVCPWTSRRECYGKKYAKRWKIAMDSNKEFSHNELYNMALWCVGYSGRYRIYLDLSSDCPQYFHNCSKLRFCTL